jgi:hypothetical protein
MKCLINVGPWVVSHCLGMNAPSLRSGRTVWWVQDDKKWRQRYRQCLMLRLLIYINFNSLNGCPPTKVRDACIPPSSYLSFSKQGLFTSYHGVLFSLCFGLRFFFKLSCSFGLSELLSYSFFLCFSLSLSLGLGLSCLCELRFFLLLDRTVSHSFYFFFLSRDSHHCSLS